MIPTLLVASLTLLGPGIYEPTGPGAERGFEPREVHDLLARLGSMTPEQQLQLYFGSVPEADARRYGGKAYDFDRLRNDPAFAHHFPAIQDVWLLEWAADAEALPFARRWIEVKVMVARNLYFRRLEPTLENVREEVARIRKIRRRYGDLPIFGDRTVVFEASPQAMDDGRRAFGRSATLRFLADQSHRLILQQGRLRRAKRGEKSLSDVLRQEPRVTFVFEGHGNSKALNGRRRLSARRLAAVFAGRPAHYPPPIVILEACYAHDFARRLASSLRRRGAKVMPIFIVPDEMGQALIKQVFSAGFLRFDVGSANDLSKELTLSTVLGSTAPRMTVYFPDSDHVLRQIG